MQRQPVKPGLVRLRIRVAHRKVSHQRARMGSGHAGAKTKLPRHRAGGGHDVPLPGARDQDGGPPPQYRPCERSNGRRWAAAATVIGGHGLKDMLGRLAAPSHLTHGRALMGWQRVDLGLAGPAAERAFARPAGTGAPASRLGERSGSRIVVDRRSEARGGRDRGWLRQPGGTLCVAQPLYRELRQVERGDPCHRKPRVREKRDCRSAAGQARPTSAAGQGRLGGVPPGLRPGEGQRRAPVFGPRTARRAPIGRRGNTSGSARLGASRDDQSA